MKVSRVNPTKRLELERDLYGTTHAEVGAYLLSIWGFSHRIVEHTAPSQPGNNGREKFRHDDDRAHRRIADERNL